MKPFVGRDSELQRLEDLSKSGRACLVVIKGRRRIGKSRLAEEFGKDKVFLPFSGLAPVKGVTAQNQRDAFARELATLFNLPPFTFTDWSDAFAHLSRHLSCSGSGLQCSGSVFGVRCSGSGLQFCNLLFGV